MLGLVAGLALAWYYFNSMENNSYIKNVIIYSITNFAVLIIEQLFSGGSLDIISYIISSIIGGLIFVKILEFVKNNTNTFFGFVVLAEICQIGISFCIAFVLYTILR